MGRNRNQESVISQTDLAVACIESDPDNPDGYLLLLDGAQQSYVDLSDPTNLQFEYVRWIGHALSALPAGTLRVLHLGGGGLTLPRYVSATRPGSRSTVVERDALLIDLVRAKLPWGPGIRVRVADARAELAAVPAASYDVVISDVFDSARTPGSLTSVEYFARTREVLLPSGLFCANIADQSPFAYARRFLAGVVATYPEVAVLADPAVWRGRRFGNFVIVAGETLPNDLSWRAHHDTIAVRVVQARALDRFLAGAAAFTDADAPGSPEPPEGVFGPPR